MKTSITTLFALMAAMTALGMPVQPSPPSDEAAGIPTGLPGLAKRQEVSPENAEAIGAIAAVAVAPDYDTTVFVTTMLPYLTTSTLMVTVESAA